MLGGTVAKDTVDYSRYFSMKMMISSLHRVEKQYTSTVLVQIVLGVLYLYSRPESSSFRSTSTCGVSLK